jgi:branched-chain amino acid transport system permease protein
MSDRAQLGVGIATIVASIVLPAITGNQYWSHTFHLVNLYIVVAVLQKMLLADAGQVSFGQGAVFGAPPPGRHRGDLHGAPRARRGVRTARRSRWQPVRAAGIARPGITTSAS